MTKIKDLIESYKKDGKNLFNKIKDSLDIPEDSDRTLKPNKHKRFYEEDKELTVGIIAVILIVLIIISLSYYYLYYQPSMSELNDQKNSKINEVNKIFKDDLENDQTKQAILSKIDSASSIEELQSIDVEAMAKPALINNLLNQLGEYKDKYNRVDLIVENSSNIMSVDNATKFINSSTTDELLSTSLKSVDTVIVPLSLDRKQAASGLLKEGDTVNIFLAGRESSTGEEVNEETSTNNSTEESENVSIESNMESKDTLQSSKIVGGAQIVSILRSRDSGSIDSDIQLSSSTNSTNYSQSSNVDIEEALSSKAAGTLNENKLNLILSEYGWRLSDYERTSNIGDLDVEYLIMVEVPQDKTSELIDNMDDLILTIPTNDAPSWVNLSHS